MPSLAQVGSNSPSSGTLRTMVPSCPVKVVARGRSAMRLKATPAAVLTPLLDARTEILARVAALRTVALPSVTRSAMPALIAANLM